MSVTIQDIASRAGVSKVTVSRVLRGQGKNLRADAAKRSQKILALASEMGYRPNWRAKVFAEKKTGMIGWLSGDAAPPVGPINARIRHEFEKRLLTDGYQLLLVPVLPGSEKWREVILDRRLDATVIIHACPEHLTSAVYESGLPGVVISVGEKQGRLAGVDVDDVAGGRLATDHLLKLGHRKIAYVTVKMNSGAPHPSVDHRHSGYLQSMESSGLKSQSWLDADLAQVADACLAEDAPTAIIAYSHIEATRLLRLCWERGINVPRDLSVIAFNDVGLVADLIPPLTVIDIQEKEVGKLGANLLLSQIEDTASQPSSILVQPQLVIRRSTQHPAQ